MGRPLVHARGAIRRTVTRGAALCALLCACEGGGLSTQQLSEVVEAGQPHLKRCYDDALAEHPLKDEVRLEAVIHVTASGQVSAVELEPAPPLPGLATCLNDAIGRWRFPTADEGTSTALPLIFRPEVVEQALE